MQLVNGTLRCLRVLRSKLNVQLVVNNNVQVGANGFNSHFNQQRSYASASAVAISTEQFDGPTTDPSRSPLVTFHGLFGSKQNWRSISKSLAAKTNRRVRSESLSLQIQCHFHDYEFLSDLYGRSTQSWR